MSERDAAPSPEPAAARVADRRAYVRLASNLAVTCHPPGREVGWAGRVRDISAGGLGLLLRHRFRPGTHLTVDLKDCTGQPLRSVPVRVVHATAVLVEGAHAWLLGCAFEQPLSDDELQGLR